jgi:hypothetical protein
VNLKGFLHCLKHTKAIHHCLGNDEFSPRTVVYLHILSPVFPQYQLRCFKNSRMIPFLTILSLLCGNLVFSGSIFRHNNFFFLQMLEHLNIS